MDVRAPPPRSGRAVLRPRRGTGKLTALLAPTGADLVAVEPVEGMWLRLRTAVPTAKVLAGTAEALPFAAATLDAVTVAQAFHWFDADRAFAELARTVRTGGRIALVWNARDRSVDWVDALWSIMDRVEKRAPWRDHDRWADSALGDRVGFGPLHDATFRHEQVLDRAGVVDRFASVSHVAVLPDAERAAVLDEVRGVLDTHPATRGRAELPDPVPGRRVLVRAPAMTRSLRSRLAVTAGRATGWLSRVTGRGQGATISGRVMNAIAPDLLAELAADQHVAIVSATNGKTTTTRLLAAAVGADGRRRRHELDRREPDVRHRAGAGARLGAGHRDPRGRRARRRTSRGSALRPAARVRQPQPRPARPLRRSARRR